MGGGGGDRCREGTKSQVRLETFYTDKLLAASDLDYIIFEARPDNPVLAIEAGRYRGTELYFSITVVSGFYHKYSTGAFFAGYWSVRGLYRIFDGEFSTLKRKNYKYT